MTLDDDDNCHRARLQQIARDTIDSHTTGIFTARQAMEVLEGIDQNFNVHLYMANCAVTLVIDTRGYGTEGIQVFATGFATGFHICDSAYVFPEKSPIVRTTRVDPIDGSDEVGFCCVTFPSRDTKETSETRTIIETEEPFISERSDESLWEFRVYVPMLIQEGTRSKTSITESILHINKPQRAGEMTVIKVYRGEYGEIESVSSDVSVSVTLDWQPGNVYNPDL